VDTDSSVAGHWIPIAAFFAFGVFFLQKAVRPGAKRTWAWGRAGDGPPLSRSGYAVWGATFVYIALVIAYAPHPPIAAVLGFGVCFLALAGVGIMDTLADRRKRKASREEGDR